MQDDLDMISFGIIANSGDARHFALQALEAAHQEDWKKAEEWLDKSKQSLDLARRAQTDLLFSEMNGAQKQVNVLLVHSQDHLMCAALALDMAQQLVLVIRDNAQLKQRVEALEREWKS